MPKPLTDKQKVLVYLTLKGAIFDGNWRQYLKRDLDLGVDEQTEMLTIFTEMEHDVITSRIVWEATLPGPETSKGSEGAKPEKAKRSRKKNGGV